MPLSRISKVFAVKDAKIYPLLTDPAAGSATYGPAIDVPGIKTVGISGSIESKTLRGDNRLLDSDSVITEVTVSIEYAKLSLDVLSALMGGAVADSGTTPAQLSTWSLTADSKPMPFKLEAVSVSADTIGGDVLFRLPKVSLSSFPDLGLEEEDYKTFSAEGSASPLNAGGKWVDVVLRETAAVLA